MIKYFDPAIVGGKRAYFLKEKGGGGGLKQELWSFFTYLKFIVFNLFVN